MIDPKELRLGNYIKPVGKWECCPLSVMRVNSVQYDHVIREPVSKIGWIVGDVEDFEPIPLTNAVLEAIKGKFESVGEITIVIVESNKFCIVKFGELYFISPDFEREPSVNGCRIKDLHQLQNLYFALTGKELEIDETKLKTAIC